MASSKSDQQDESEGASDPMPLLLSDDEKRVLELYDRLQQLQLETALLTAQKNYKPTQTPAAASLEEAQTALLESRARYVLRNGVTESVLSAHPIIQAIHGSTNASPIARDLLPLVAERDAASVGLAQQTAARRGVLDDLTSVAAQGLRIARENVGLAAEVLRLAEETRRGGERAVEDPEQVAEIERLEAEVRASRQRWRVMKGTTSAVVAGSGVDWARDAGLRALVVDEDEDENQI